MELMARCGRCGALVKARGRRLYDGTVSYYTPCAAVTEASSNDMVARHACELTVLCPDCMGQLKAWFAGGPEEPQEAADSAERLTADMARDVKNMVDDVRRRCKELGIDLEAGEQ